MNKEEKIYPSMVIRSQAEAIKLLEQQNKELHNKIDKAIEFIEDRMIVEQSFCLDMKQCYELTEILKDSDVDE